MPAFGLWFMVYKLFINIMTADQMKINYFFILGKFKNYSIFKTH